MIPVLTIISSCSSVCPFIHTSVYHHCSHLYSCGVYASCLCWMLPSLTSGGIIEVHGVGESGTPSSRSSSRDTGASQLPLTPNPEVGGSSAYRLSLQRNNSKRAELAAEGHDSNDFDFREYCEEEGDRQSASSLGMHHPPPGSGGEVALSRLPPAQKLRLIGRKTVCMAVVLTSFGLAMMVTSFFFIRRHLNDRGFLLFFLVGVCALLPGLYACYNILGKYLGW